MMFLLGKFSFSPFQFAFQIDRFCFIIVGHSLKCNCEVKENAVLYYQYILYISLYGGINIKRAKFERELKLLIYYIREYGIQHMDTKIDFNHFSVDTAVYNEFYAKVHKGFFIAQNNVITFLTKILNEQKELKKELAQVRQQGDKILSAEIQKSLSYVKYQEFIIRKVMDSIAWQIFHYDLSTMRRLYCGHPAIDITDSNLSSELSYVEYSLNQDPVNFVLISDLTSFIQIGDLVTMDPHKGITIAELKEGKINNKVFEIINEAAETHCPIYLQQRLDKENDKFVEQFERSLKQIKKSSQVIDAITTGYGTDILTGQKVRIIQDEIELDTYTETVHRLSKECHKKGYSISVIEDCFLIGVYDTTKFSSTAFDFWAKGLKIDMPVFDMRMSFSDPMSYPIFLQPFSDVFIADIVSGRKVIKMTIDIDKWIRGLEENGCTVRWMSKKETARINSNMKGSNKIFDIHGRGIEIQKYGISQYIGQGIFSRMFTAFNTPESMKKLLLATFEYSKESEEWE